MSKISIPIVDLAASYRAYREGLDAAIVRVLDSGWYILGAEVARFEQAFAEYLGVAQVVGVANGTDAVALALRSLGVGAGDAVFTVAHTAVASVAAVELAGAVPVLVDVDPVSRNIDLSKLADSIRMLPRLAPGLRARAVLPVHLYGQACDMAGLLDLCRRHELELIEDCAQAHGTMIGGRKAGTFGAASAFSFYPTKNLGAFGDAGAVAFADPAAARRCRALREYGWTSRYVSEYAGINSRLDEFQAAVLSVKLPHLVAEVARRRGVAQLYQEGLSDLAGLLELPTEAPGTEHAYHLYVVRSLARDALRSFLESRGIGSAVHYPVPVHLQPAYRGRVPLGAGGLAVTEALAREVLSLPMHGFLSHENVRSVIAAVRDGVRRRGRAVARG